MARRALYGLDIETDTTDDGLDPRVARIVAVAVSSTTESVSFTGAEAAILQAVDDHLASCPRGVLVTWNGAAFDLPFVADRAERAGTALGLAIEWDPGLPSRHPPMPGHPGSYRARWHGHDHVDAYRAYRSLLEPDVSCSLKSLARLNGLDPVEVDSAAVHELGPAALRSYVTSDARVTRVLAEQRWGEVRRFVDALRPRAQLSLFDR